MYRKIKKILNFDEKKRLIQLSFISLIASALEAVGIGLIFPFVNLIVDASNLENLKGFVDTTQYSNDEIFVIIIFLILFANIFKALFISFLLWVNASFLSSVNIRLSNLLYKKYINSNWNYFINKNTATLLRNVYNEIFVFTNKILTSLITIIMEFILITFFIVMLLYIKPKETLILLSIFLFLGWISQFITKKFNIKYGELRSLYAEKINRHLIESFNGTKEIKIFKKENFFIKEFKKILSVETWVKAKQDVMQKLPRIWMEFAIILLFCLFFLKSYQTSNLDTFFIPTIALFAASAYKLIPSIIRLVLALQTLRFTKPALTTIYSAIFEEMGEINENFKKNEKIEFKKEIQIKNLKFKYSSYSKNIFDDFNLNLKKNTTIGIFGKSGSGKSTLLDLILGLLKPNSGEILVDNKKFDYQIHSWKTKIGFVPQQIHLLDDTIRRNVAFGIEEDFIDDKKVVEAIKFAQLEELILGNELGINNLVGENGIKISGGQRQRIGLARAIYLEPEVLILDEATNALDQYNEDKVFDIIKKLNKKKTIIIISHNKNIYQYCDQLVNLDDLYA